MAKKATSTLVSDPSTVFKLVSKNLTNDTYRNVFDKLIDIEPRKGYVAFRVPDSIEIVEEVWEEIVQICEENNYKCKRIGKFSTAAEYGEFLSAIDWLWYNWMPKGFLTLLVGDPGTGKSMIALDLVKKVTAGTCFPFCDKCPPSKLKCKTQNVVWVEAEAGQKILYDRMVSMNVDMSKIYIPAFDGDLLGQPNLSDETHQQQLIDIIVATDPALVVVDSLGGINTSGENRVEDVRPLMLFLARRIARDEDTSVLLIHHLRKSSGEDIELAMSRVRGSTAITAFSRAIIGIERTRTNAIMKVIKSNLGHIPKPITVNVLFDKNDRVTDVAYDEWTAPPPKKTKKERCSDWVWEVLQGHEGRIPLQDLIKQGEAEGFTRQNIYSARDILQKQITVSGTGREAFWEICIDNNTVEEISNHLGKKGE